MYVCLCEGLTDRQIESHIDRGCSSLRDVARACGAGTGCGMCRVDVQKMLRRAGRARGGSTDPLVAK